MSLRLAANRLLASFETKLTPLNRLEINSAQILKNYDAFQQLASHCQIWPVLKANAYGHGLREIASILQARRFDYVVVDSYYEALLLKHPALIIGSILPANLHLLDFSKIALMVQDKKTINTLGQLNRPIKIHLKINTGMNRQGIDISQIQNYLNLIKLYPNLILEGIMSHLADANNPKYSQHQLSAFLRCLDYLHPKYVHISATDGVQIASHPQINAVRLGLGLYQNSLRLISTITKIRKLNKGDFVGYNCTYQSKKSTNIAIIPVGYYEALDRRLSNCGFVKYKNQFLPIIGRVCMNMIIVDLLDSKAQEWDEVEVISPNPKDQNSIESMAKLINASPYELFTRISPTIRRQIL